MTELHLQLITTLLQEIVARQNESNALLHRIAVHLEKNDQSQQVKAWQNANPGLSKLCKQAAEHLAETRQELIEEITSEIIDQDAEGYMFGEFIDKTGSRIFHVNNILQMLVTLGTPI